jgi:hypothetical protein
MMIILMKSMLTIAAITFIRNSSLVAEWGGVFWPCLPPQGPSKAGRLIFLASVLCI